MMQAKVAMLADRGVLRIGGADAAKLLQDVITSDLDLLSVQPAIHAALLTPQGKILFEFFVVRGADGYLLEMAADQVAGLAKRLAMYRLRAQVDISDDIDQWDVWTAWGAPSLQEPWMSDQSGDEDLRITDMGFLASVGFYDPRLHALGHRWIVPRRLRSQLTGLSASNSFESVSFADYHAHRVALGVPEAGKDYPLGDTFPHEADMDQLGGVSFSKGCFVGQEVVSRMQHRTAVRKRVVPVAALAGTLQSGSDITTGTATIGKIGSVAGGRALALLRLDRAAEAKAKGQPLLAGGVEIIVRKPDWATFDLAPKPAAAETP